MSTSSDEEDSVSLDNLEEVEVEGPPMFMGKLQKQALEDKKE
jgi:hypothetical protein